MKPSHWLWLVTIWAASACNLYNDALLGNATGDDDGPSGGNATGGDDTGGGGSTGGSSTGGTTSGGGSSGDGGTGGEDMGGAGGGDGTGGETGGNSGGGGSGGSGGGGSGGGSGGGGPAIGLIDDFEDTSAGYNNQPFYGSWSRYLQPNGVWTAATVGAMMQPRPDDAEKGAFHVQATMLDDWGLGTFVTLKGSGLPMDLTGVTGIRFSVITMNDEVSLKVALADGSSHSPACEDVNAGADCDKHIRTVDVIELTSSWTEIELPLANFLDKAVATPAREADLDITQVYAIHIQMDPEAVEEEADFYIDDLEAY